MIRLTRFPALCIGAFVLVACQVVYSHNLFVLVEAQSDGPEVINVIFEHGPSPGKGTYNQPLLVRGQTWIRNPGVVDVVELELKEITTHGKKFFQADAKVATPRVIGHSCTWGVYKGRLDHFYGKYLDVTSAEETASLAREQRLPLDLVPAVENDALVITVLYKDEPLANARVSIWSPSGKEWVQRTDSEGQTELKNLRKGVYSFATAHTLKDSAGEFNGERYNGVMHATTCSLRWPFN